MTVVVLDNARIHTGKKMRERVEVWQRRGLFVFYLPTYSPHMNIAETVWRKLGVVSGINLIILLWTNGERRVPVGYRIFDKDTDGKTTNDHFAEMLLAAHQRGFSPTLVCFDSWYSSIENLKLVRGLGWHFLTRLKSNRKVNPDKSGLQPVSEIFISAAGRIVRLSGFGLVKVFRLIDTEGNAER